MRTGWLQSAQRGDKGKEDFSDPPSPGSTQGKNDSVNMKEKWGCAGLWWLLNNWSHANLHAAGKLLWKRERLHKNTEVTVIFFLSLFLDLPQAYFHSICFPVA